MNNPNFATQEQLASGVAYVDLKSITEHGETRIQALVWRGKRNAALGEFGGGFTPQVEWIIESLDEAVIRRALKRAGYPSGKRELKVRVVS